MAEWMRKAELAVSKKNDELARAALERHKSHQQLAESFKEQVADQSTQVESLKTALRKLEHKLAEAEGKAEMLMAQHRRARASGKASDASLAMGDRSKSATFDRMKNKVQYNEAVATAKVEVVNDDLDDKFAQLDKEDEIERMLTELKQRVAG